MGRDGGQNLTWLRRARSSRGRRWRLAWTTRLCLGSMGQHERQGLTRAARGGAVPGADGADRRGRHGRVQGVLVRLVDKS